MALAQGLSESCSQDSTGLDLVWRRYFKIAHSAKCVCVGGMSPFLACMLSGVNSLSDGTLH